MLINVKMVCHKSIFNKTSVTWSTNNRYLKILSFKIKEQAHYSWYDLLLSLCMLVRQVGDPRHHCPTRWAYKHLCSKSNFILIFGLISLSKACSKQPRSEAGFQGTRHIQKWPNASSDNHSGVGAKTKTSLSIGRDVMRSEWRQTTYPCSKSLIPQGPWTLELLILESIKTLRSLYI